MRAASLFVDRRESALNEAGDYLLAAAEGAIGPEHIKAELGEVLVGLNRGRQSADEITLFKSLGLAVEDLAAAEFVFRQAQRQGVGAWTEF
jgi:ornithine cyclodeaminase